MRGDAFFWFWIIITSIIVSPIQIPGRNVIGNRIVLRRLLSDPKHCRTDIELPGIENAIVWICWSRRGGRSIRSRSNDSRRLRRWRLCAYLIDGPKNHENQAPENTGFGGKLQRGLVESQKHQNQVSLASKGPMRGRHYDIYLISIQEDFRWR